MEENDYVDNIVKAFGVNKKMLVEDIKNPDFAEKVYKKIGARNMYDMDVVDAVLMYLSNEYIVTKRRK